MCLFLLYEHAYRGATQYLAVYVPGKRNIGPKLGFTGYFVVTIVTNGSVANFSEIVHIFVEGPHVLYLKGQVSAGLDVDAIFETMRDIR